MNAPVTNQRNTTRWLYPTHLAGSPRLSKTSVRNNWDVNLRRSSTLPTSVPDRPSRYHHRFSLMAIEFGR